MAQTQNIEKQINHYLSVLSENKKKAVLTVVKTLVEDEEADFWDELPDEVKASALRGIKQANKGQFKSHEEVMSRYKKWLKK
jgi:predicted transcriptional regulator